MGKSSEEDRHDRKASQLRKQRGRGGKKGEASHGAEYVPLADLARDTSTKAAYRQRVDTERKAMADEFTKYVGGEVAAIKLAIKHTGAAEVKSSVKGFQRIVFELKTAFYGSSVQWSVTEKGIVFGVNRC